MGRLSTAVDPAWYHREERPQDPRLAVQFLGTAGFRVVSAGQHVWLDPHLSRHSVAELLFGKIAPKPDRIAAEVDIAHAVAVGHSHYDHALDAPEIARLHDATVYGSADTLHWCRGHGVPDRLLHELRGEGETHAIGELTLRAVKSEHSPFLAGRVPFAGRIETTLTGPAPMSAWRVGPVFGLHLSGAAGSVYHVGSAALLEAELAGIQADIVLCCTIGRHATPRFTHRVIDALRPKLVIPCHWDQFWRPLDAPVRQIPTNDLAGFLAEVQSHPNAPEVRVLPLRGWTTFA
jgi:L-ascorbate metabolism protein UlaG (beta-lactamase superfamily)